MEKLPYDGQEDVKMKTQLSVAEICTILDDYQIEDVYEILSRNDLALPSRGGHWATKKMMLAMFKSETFCPTYGQL